MDDPTGIRKIRRYLYTITGRRGTRFVQVQRYDFDEAEQAAERMAECGYRVAVVVSGRMRRSRLAA